MKKLMIAAVAAAMIGGVEATTLAYDFTATLKTTVGKGGKDIKKTYTVNAGVNDDGTFWYEQAGLPKGPFANDKEAKAAVAKMTNDEKVALAYAIGWDEVGQKTAYNNKHMKKWCVTFKVTITDFAQCYRVAGTQKIRKTLYTETCCEETGASLYTDRDFAEEYLQIAMLQRFGAQKLASANKVEMFGIIGTAADGTADNFSLAGQGTWSAKLYKESDGNYYAGVSSVSGNIVGALVTPNCVTCCSNDEPAIAWDCWAEADADAYAPDTAAYGTWTLKFNKKASDID